MEFTAFPEACPLQIVQGQGSIQEVLTLLSRLGDAAYPKMLSSSPICDYSHLAVAASHGSMTSWVRECPEIGHGMQASSGRRSGEGGNRLILNKLQDDCCSPCASEGAGSMR